MFARLLIVVGATSSLSACVFHIAPDDWDDANTHKSVRAEERDARKYIAALELGVAPATVISELGAPEFSDRLTTKDGEVRVLRYRTHRAHADGETTRDETTPLVFLNDKLIGSGELALQQITGR